MPLTASFAGAAVADCTAIIMAWNTIRQGAASQHPRAKFAQQIAPRPALRRSGQGMGWNLPKCRKPEDMLARAIKKCGRDGSVHEIFFLQIGVRLVAGIRPRRLVFGKWVVMGSSGRHGRTLVMEITKNAPPKPFTICR